MMQIGGLFLNAKMIMRIEIGNPIVLVMAALMVLDGMTIFPVVEVTILVVPVDVMEMAVALAVALAVVPVVILAEIEFLIIVPTISCGNGVDGVPMTMMMIQKNSKVVVIDLGIIVSIVLMI